MGNRQPTREEYDRGWMVLACEEHVYVFRAAPMKGLPKEALEFCPEVGNLMVKRECLDKTWQKAETK